MTLPQVLEALLFASPKPMTTGELRVVLKSTAEFTEEPLAAELARVREADLANMLAELAADFQRQGRAIELREGAAGWHLTTAAGCAPWVRQLFPETRPPRLSAPALETLAIIAYRQPIARSEVEAVRGVDAGGVVQTLLDRGLIRIAGRAEAAGRPLLYATTQFFLEHFGLKNFSELPAFEELKKSLADAEGRQARNQPGAMEAPLEVTPVEVPAASAAAEQPTEAGVETPRSP